MDRRRRRRRPPDEILLLFIPRECHSAVVENSLIIIIIRSHQQLYSLPASLFQVQQQLHPSSTHRGRGNVCGSLEIKLPHPFLFLNTRIIHNSTGRHLDMVTRGMGELENLRMEDMTKGSLSASSSSKNISKPCRIFPPSLI